MSIKADPHRMQFEVFEVLLEKTVVFSGEEVKGKLFLRSNKYQNCDKIELKLIGMGNCSFYDKKVNVDNHRTYCNMIQTLWRNNIKALVVRKENCNNGSITLDNNQGVLHVPIQENQFFIVVKIKNMIPLKEIIIGEVTIDIYKYVDQEETQIVSFNVGNESSEAKLTFRMRWGTALNSTTRVILLQIDSIDRLTVEDWKKNEACIQAYTVDGLQTTDVKVELSDEVATPDTPTSEAVVVVASHSSKLVPSNSFKFPPCDTVIPFSFLLPSDIPSSFKVDAQNCIKYNLIADIVGAVNLSRSSITYEIVVLQQRSFFPYSLENHLTFGTHSHFFIPPICCFNIPLVCLSSHGDINIVIKLDSSSYAVKENILLKIVVDCAWINARNLLQFFVSMERLVTYQSDSEKKEIPSTILGPLAIDNIEHGLEIPVADLAPTFPGGPEDPIVWSYRIHVEVKFKPPGCVLYNNTKHLFIPIDVVKSKDVETS